MTGLHWIILFIWATGCHQSTSSQVGRSTLLVHKGHNVSLTFNITPSSEITCYLLRSNQLLPLLRVKYSQLSSLSRWKENLIDRSELDTSRIKWTGNMESGQAGLEIQLVEEEDSGVYYVSGISQDKLFVSTGIHLKLNGADGDTVERKPRLSLEICVLPGLLGLCTSLILAFYLCSVSGKLCHYGCNPGRQRSSLRVTEEDFLHYSSLRHLNKPRSSIRTGPRLVEDLVTYSTLAKT